MDYYSNAAMFVRELSSESHSGFAHVSVSSLSGAVHLLESQSDLEGSLDIYATLLGNIYSLSKLLTHILAPLLYKLILSVVV